MSLNQELHEAFGYCWHELVRNDVDIAKDVISAKVHVCKKCGYKTNDCQEECNPDYVAEPWLVIREMEKIGMKNKVPKETSIRYSKILDLGCSWEYDPYNGDGDCGHGYPWDCDYCPVVIENQKALKDVNIESVFSY